MGALASSGGAHPFANWSYHEDMLAYNWSVPVAALNCPFCWALFTAFRCLSLAFIDRPLPFHCLSLTFHWLFLACHCLFTAFHHCLFSCLSLFFHCLSLTSNTILSPGARRWDRGHAAARAAVPAVRRRRQGLPLHLGLARRFVAAHVHPCPAGHAAPRGRRPGLATQPCSRSGLARESWPLHCAGSGVEYSTAFCRSWLSRRNDELVSAICTVYLPTLGTEVSSWFQTTTIYTRTLQHMTTRSSRDNQDAEILTLPARRVRLPRLRFGRRPQLRFGQ